jgi:hypothetical protein
MTFKFGDEILPRAYGFPMKIRVPTKLGFKNPKYVISMEVTNDYKGGFWEDQGYNSFSGYAYMYGCSNGGRHAMVDAGRMPEMYDGFLVGNPGFDLPKSAIQHAWDFQNFTKVDPDIRKSFSRDDAKLVSAKIVEACDALDGVKDGMTGNLRACQKAFDFASLKCAPGTSEGCLSDVKVSALKAIFGGPKNSKAKRSIRIGRSTAVSAPAIGGCGKWRARLRPGTMRQMIVFTARLKRRHSNSGGKRRAPASRCRRNVER